MYLMIHSYESYPARFQSLKRKGEEIQYYRGNISSLDLETLNPKEWLNDIIINRYIGTF